MWTMTSTDSGHATSHIKIIFIITSLHNATRNGTVHSAANRVLNP